MGAKERHAEISAAVAVVVELNTPLALPPPINKTLKCFRRKGAASLSASHFLNALWTLRLCFDTTHTHWFSPFGTLSLAPSHPVFTFPHIHSENIHAYAETFACNLPRVCAVLQGTLHMYRTPSTCTVICTWIYMNACIYLLFNQVKSLIEIKISSPREAWPRQ